jgi:hypothetical protein
MFKATYREVAARLEIEPVEALNMLREQREQGLCDFFDGGWEVTGGADGKTSIRSAPAKTVLRAKILNDTPKKPLRGEVTEPIKPEAIVALLTENGIMDTVALASAVGRDPRGLASNLCLMAKRRYINKIGQGKGVKWGLPDETKIIPEPVFAELPDIEITPKVAMLPAQAPSTEREHVSAVTETFLESIPVLRKPSQPMQIPSLREINNQIRKVKSNLHGLEKLRVAVREVNKHRRALNLFSGEDL